MRKQLILILLIAFSFQFCWAAASAFCQHETDKGAQHFGHHPHHHSSTGLDKSADDGDDDHEDNLKKPLSAKKTNSHPDCATCSQGGSLVMELQISSLDFPLRENLNSLALVQPATPFLAEPERPKWMIAV